MEKSINRFYSLVFIHSFLMLTRANILWEICITYFKMKTQTGYGGIRMFRAPPLQRGHGIGGIFKGLFRTISPFIKYLKGRYLSSTQFILSIFCFCRFAYKCVMRIKGKLLFFLLIGVPAPAATAAQQNA